MMALAAPAHAADRLTLQLDGDAQDWAGYARALTAGYYTAEGLEVALRAPDGDAATAALARGLADVAVDWTGPALAARAQGLPVVQIATRRPITAQNLVCRADLGIQTPADLARRTIAAGTDGRQAATLAFLSASGVAPTSVRFIPQGPGLNYLTDSRAHCITLRGDQSPALSAAGFPPDTLRRFSLPDIGQDGLFTLRPTLNDPDMADRLARFLRASEKGWADLAAAADWTPNLGDAAATAAALNLSLTADDFIDAGLTAAPPAP